MSKVFKNPYWSILWTVIRLYVGYEWLTAGWEKVTGPQNSMWIGSKAGTIIKGFLTNAVKNSVATPQNPHPTVQGWYAWIAQHIFLPIAPVFSYLVAFGELAVGIGLILGIFTTIALYAAALMNLVYMLSGSTSTNPQLYTLEIILLVVGASAYSIGLDRWIIPWCKEKLGMKNTPPRT